MSIKFKILLVFIPLCLSLCFMSNTYSRYVADTNGNVEMLFAKWQILVNEKDIANNSSYTANIPNYTEEIELGAKMTLYYDFLSPESVGDKRSGYIGYLAAILGVILIVKTGPRFVRIIKDNYL